MVLIIPNTYGEQAWPRGSMKHYSWIFKSNRTNIQTPKKCEGDVSILFKVPRKDHEVVIMSSSAGTDFFELIYFVLRGKNS